MQTLIDSVRHPIAILAEDLRIEIANQAFYEAFDLTPDETVGVSIYECANGELNIPALRNRLGGLLGKAGMFHHIEVIHEHQTLGRQLMHVAGRMLEGAVNSPKQIVLSFEDVTDRTRTNDDLARVHQELVVAYEDLQRFTYVVSHDLRSPARSALLNLQVLRQSIEKNVDREALERIDDSIACVKRLSDLIIDLIRFAETTNAPVKLSTFPAKEAILTALKNLQHHITSSGAIVTLSDMPLVQSDRTPLTMVFQNFISNAIKYRRAGPPRIRIDCIRDGPFWQFSVADNGAGFEPEYASAVFEGFKRLHWANIPGSGIGLANNKATIKRLGGKIWAESIVGEGSTFFFHSASMS